MAGTDLPGMHGKLLATVSWWIPPYPPESHAYSLVPHHLWRTRTVETHGPLGTLWVGLGLGAFYTALIWVNILLGHMLTPLFILPLTWIQDAMAKRKTK